MSDPQTTRRPSLKDRIRLNHKSGITNYHDLMTACFPRDQYPRAFNYSSNGGPPGCAMAFNRALREMGGGTSWPERRVWLPREVKAA